MILHITGHDGIYLHAILKESHTALSVDLHLGYILDPIPRLEGIRIQERSLECIPLHLWGPPPGVSWAWSLLSEGPRLPSSVPSPPCGLNATSLLMLLLMGSHRWSPPNCYNDNNTFLPSGCLSRPLQGHATPWIPPWPSSIPLGSLHFLLLYLSWHSPLPGVPSTQWVF